MQTTAALKPPETTEQADQETTYQVKVTRRHTITLPAELRQAFDIEDGDVFDLQVDGDQLVLRRSRSDAVARLEGTLSPYFKDREEIQRFVDEERSGWSERDAQLEARVARMEGILADLYPTREDVQQFVEDERRGWTERDAKLEERWKQGEQRQGPDSTSTS